MTLIDTMPVSTRPAVGRRVLLNSSGNVNIIDGSTIWLISMAEVLARTGAEVTLLLNTGIYSTRMLAPILELPTVRVIDPFAGRHVAESTRLSPREVADLAADLDRESPFDIVITRGRQVCAAFAASKRFDGRLWPYVIDLPEAGSVPESEDLAALQEIALASQRMLVQTEDSRSYTEFRVPASIGKCLVTYPVVPDDLVPLPSRRRPEPGRLSGVYSGKFAEGWRTLELCDLPSRVARRGVDLNVSLIGDKFMHFPQNPSWRGRMQQAVRTSPGIEWAGGMTREDANAYTRTADIGFSWRSRALDSTHELSTKVLEYCALGVAPVLNRIAAHVDLLGEDYPLFVSEDVESVERAIVRVAHDPDVLEDARERAMAAVAYFRMSSAAERIGAAIAMAPKASEVLTLHDSAPRTAFIGEHLDSASSTYAGLSRIAGGVRVLDWSSRARGLEQGRVDELRSAEIVVLDGADPYLAWTVSRSEPEQVLVLRSHTPHVDLELLGGAALARVDAVVAETAAAAAVLRSARPELTDRVSVISPAVDTDYFDRPGLPDREFRIGMLDLWPIERRPDAAVRLLRELLDRDSRYSLHLRSSRPWENAERWSQIGERDYYSTLLAQVEGDPQLRSRVGFEDEGPDLPGWFRTVGWLFEPRRGGRAVDVRTLQAQAAGVVVVSPDDPDAVELYGAAQAFMDLSSLADHIVATSTSSEALATAQAAARERAATADVTAVTQEWDSLITRVREQAADLRTQGR